MGITIIRPSERVSFDEHALGIHRPDGSGYSFPCDEDGNLLDVKPWSLASAWFDEERSGIRLYGWANLTRAIAEFCDGEATIAIDRYHQSWIEPAVGRCHCGAEVELSGGFWGTSCENCGRSYNSSGQELNPPHMWEEREYYDDTHTIAERLHGYDD